MKVGGLASSYPFAETWHIKASEQELINAIAELHKTNLNFQPPEQEQLIGTRDTGYIWSSSEMQEYLKRLQADSLIPLPEKNYSNYYHDYWLHITLYYPDTKEIVRAWARPDLYQGGTTFALVGFSNIEDPQDLRFINSDFWYIPNRKQIRKFKSIFVDKIREQIKKSTSYTETSQ